MAFLHAGGTVVKRELRNELIRVDTGCLVAFSPDASPISWEPKGSSAEPGWVLHLRPGAEGSPSILVRPLEAPPPGAWTVRPDDGEPGAISVGSPSAGKAAGHAESD